MWKIFQRRRLISQGLASGKIRRRLTESPLLEALEEGWQAKAVIMALFVVGLGALVFSGTAVQSVQNFVICLLVFATAIVALWINYPNSLASNSRLLLILSACFVQLLAVRLLFGDPVPAAYAPVLFPYAFAPLVLCVLIGKHHGLFVALFCSLWGSFLLPTADIYNAISLRIFIVLSLITGFVAVFVTQQVRSRRRLIRAGLYIGAATWLVAATFGLIGPVQMEGTNWRLIGWQSLFAVSAGFITAILVSGILPALETMFGITTDISWIEMTDMNNPLLRRLSMEAPGTYHHSLAVANLAEAAAETIGANPTICRVCAYFHDIGKLVKPEYFTENMPPGHNPHDELTPTMSALIIIAHVKEGVDLALKHKLNPAIVDCIQQHHGTSLVGYFYQRALQQQQDARLGGKIMNLRDDDIPEVREESFRYPGPKPQTKESAIVSLADSIESASRSIERPTAQRIDDLVTDIIDGRIADHQLDECPLTLDELRRIGESLRTTLASMMHSRVAYPSARRETKEPRDAAVKRSEHAA
jgi:putative nucleotidyltransferase with HDIG domain